MFSKTGAFKGRYTGWRSKGVGPNAVNLTEIAVLSNPYGFRVGAVAAMRF